MVRKKIRSERGASLSMALLLFLVCTVAGSVVLTAATAASGRLSDMAEMDQRYYSVSSAAALLARELDGETVTIVRVRDTSGAEPVYTTTNIGEELTFTDTQQVDITGSSFLTRMAAYLMFGESLECNTESAWGYTFSLPNDIQSETFILSHLPNSADEDISGIEIDVKPVLEKDGTLNLKLSRTTDGKTYSLVIVLKPEFRECTIIDDNTETKVSTVTWSVSGMRSSANDD